MFTGLIEDIGILRDRQIAGGTAKLVVETQLPLTEINLGDSIAVNGACLTVERLDTARNNLIFHTLAETIKRTNLGLLPISASVNLERALRLGDRLGGHLVSGHIDVTGDILSLGRSGPDYVMKVSIPEEIMSLIIAKGSIAVDGVSLTIADLADKSFSVHIIPHTWEHTCLGDANPGRKVNLEADMLGKYILRQQQVGGRKQSTISMDYLHKAGF